MAAPPTTTTTTTASSASITQRRVAKLLDTVVDEHLRELVKYVETYVPHCGGGDVCTSHQDPNNNNNINGVAAGDDDAVVVVAAPTAMELRTALDGRSADMHRAFLREFELLHKTYHVAAGHVAKLHQQCQTLDDALQARASETESFIHTMRPLQKELMYVRQHEVQMKEFDAQLNFGAVERKRLEEDPINPAYLDVLERAREAHRRCKKLLLSRDHQQSAGVLMEATYAAISGAMERISRYLLVASADGTQQNNNSGGGVLSRGASTAGTTMSADVPEVSSFYLRCVHVLLEESPPHWERIMDEVSRRRRASVLRRYFHLLTTGSSTTSSGVYAADGRSPSASPRDGTNNNNNNVDGERGRPLEAELHNPIVFFSALFAWLHQTIVEEEDLLRSFIPPGACTQEGTTATPTTTSVMVKTVAEDGEAADEAAIISARRDPNATIIALLDLIFDGITKHVRGALRGVLERFLRVSSSLAPTNEDGGDVAARGATTGAKITRGIARLLSAATGRATSVVADSTAPLAQRYAHVVTRTQQEGLALSILQGPVNGLRTCFALMQLLRFYDLTALRPLLGPTSSLSSFVAEATQVDLQQAFHQLVKVVSAHLLDSVAGVVARTTVLQQHHLSEMIWIASDLQHQQPSSSSSSSSLAARGNEAHDYLLQHLFAHLPSGAVEEAADGGGGDDGSTNMSRSLSRSSFVDINAAQMLLAPQQQVVRAAEMLRVLTTFVLPVSAEVEACLEVLESLLHDTARQRATIQAYVEQQKMAGAGVGVGADEEDGINASLLTQPEQYFSPLVQALLSFTAHALPHVIATRVDVACRTIMELNVLFRLRAILAPFAESLELRAVATAVDEKIASVEVHLMDRYAVAAAHFFMPSAHMTSANPTPASGADGVMVVKEEEDSVAVLLQQLEQSTKELSALYALIASTGRFPTLPCLSALEEKNIATRVVQHVGQHLISVFRQQHTRLMELVKTSSAALGAAVVQERTSALMEISPEHLIRLVDAKAFRTSAS